MFLRFFSITSNAPSISHAATDTQIPATSPGALIITPEKVIVTTPGADNKAELVRRSYDEIPPRVEYSLSEKGSSVVPILQSICRWSGVFYKEDADNQMTQCQRCDYN